ncbi:T9SS type A sorting domain-containing protein [bacterium]|nr:T9SS type A sorting domain-containing protein [bacterium]
MNRLFLSLVIIVLAINIYGISFNTTNEDFAQFDEIEVSIQSDSLILDLKAFDFQINYDSNILHFDGWQLNDIISNFTIDKAEADSLNGTIHIIGCIDNQPNGVQVGINSSFVNFHFTAIEVGVCELSWQEYPNICCDSNLVSYRLDTFSHSLIIHPDLNGSGSEQDPFLITNLDELRFLSENPGVVTVGYHFQLLNDIDASETENWNAGFGLLPIGNLTDRFRGGFDGNGHTISNLYINRPEQDYVGLFGYIDESIISNIGLIDSDITGKMYVGSLAGYSSCSTIDNSYATGNVSSNGSVSGGLIGSQASGTVNNCYASGSLSCGWLSYGGLIGYLISGTVNNCYATVSVDSYGGGLVGYSNSGATINNSFWDIETSGLTTSAGGIGLTTYQMKTPSYFVDAGWSLIVYNAYDEADWGFRPDINECYPALIWQIPDVFDDVDEEAPRQPSDFNYMYGEVEVPVDGTLSWTFGENTETYDVYFDTVYPPENMVIDEEIAGENGTYSFEDLLYGTRYYWKIVTKNSYSEHNTNCIGWFNTTTGVNNYVLEVSPPKDQLLDYLPSELLFILNDNIEYVELWFGDIESQTEVVIPLTIASDTLTYQLPDIDYLHNQYYWTLVYFDTELMEHSLNGYFITPLNNLGGDGSESSPIQISTLNELQIFNNLYPYHNNSDPYFELANDIDASATIDWNEGAGFEPIGSNDNRFTGNFKGNGFIISNLYINRPTQDYVGLFGYTDNSNLASVYLEDVDINANQNVGGLSGCKLWGQVNDCFVTGIVSGTSEVGGLIGKFHYGPATNCYASVNVSGSGNNVGGLIGDCLVALDSCYATGNVSGSGNATGGLIGYQRGGDLEEEFTNCYSTGNVSGSYQVGGLVGLSFGIYGNCYATGNVSGSSRVGGLIGNQGSPGWGYSGVRNCYATGNVDGDDNDVGGLIGFQYTGTTSNSYATGDISGSSLVGGLVGILSSGTVNNSYATGNVNGDYAGGLIGYLWTGGIASNSYATGGVTGSSHVGGLIGFLNSGTVNNSFWDIETSGQTTSAGGSDATGLTTQQMKTPAIFVDADWSVVGFNADIDGDWFFNPSINDLYPALSWQVSGVVAPILTYPRDNGETAITGEQLIWEADLFEHATSYLLSVGTDNPPTNILHNQDIGLVTNYLFAGIGADAEYYWQVIPVDADGNEAENCPIRSFSTVNIASVLAQNKIIESTIPINGNYPMSYSQTIFFQSELTSIDPIIDRLYLKRNTSESITGSENLRIYLAHTDKTEFEAENDWVTITDGLIQVAEISVGEGDWVELQFENPFIYNQNDNLVVGIADYVNNANTSISPFLALEVDGYRSISYCSDSSIPYPIIPYEGTRHEAVAYIAFEIKDIVVGNVSPVNGVIELYETESQLFQVFADDPLNHSLLYSWKLDCEEVSNSDSLLFNTDYDTAGEYSLTLSISRDYSSYNRKQNPTLTRRNVETFEWTIIVHDIDQNIVITDLSFAFEEDGVWNPIDQIICENETLNFYINASDPDGNDLTYSWLLNHVEVSASSLYQFQTDYNLAGSYTLELILDDNYIREQIITSRLNNRRNSKSSSMSRERFDNNPISKFSVDRTLRAAIRDTQTFTWQIEVSDVDQTIVIHDLSYATALEGVWTPVDQFISETETLNFYINASDPDSNDLTYSWILNGTEVSTSATYLFETDYDSAGEYTLELIINDNYGDVALRNIQSFNWNIEVTDVDQEIEITDLSYATELDGVWTPEDQMFEEHTILNFFVNAFDPDGQDLSYEWQLNDTVVSDTQSFDYDSSNYQNNTYEVKLTLSDGFRDTQEYIWSVVQAVSNEDDIEAITVTKLGSIYPNPFNPSTTINFNIARKDIASMRIYNIKGQLVKDFGEFVKSQNTVTWYGQDNNNKSVGSGLYLVVMKSKSNVETKKIILMK